MVLRSRGMAWFTTTVECSPDRGGLCSILRLSQLPGARADNWIMKYQSRSFMRTLLLSLCLFPSACAGPDGTASDGGSSGDASDVASGADCVTPSGSGTPHAGTIAQDETWTAAASPHLISSDIGIRARVTIEACAVVRVAADK